MKCRTFQKQISAYLDGELPPREQQKLEAHLDQCETCARMYEQLLQLTRSLKLLRQNPPPGMWSAIHQRLEDRSARKSSIAWTPRWKLLGVGAAILLLIGLGLYFLFPISSPEEVPFEYYLEAHAMSAIRMPFTPDPMVAFVFPEPGSRDVSSFDEETELILEWYLQGN